MMRDFTMGRIQQGNDLEQGRISLVNDDLGCIWIRPKPIDIKSGQCWNCFGCRRRGLSSKIAPIIIQVIIITVVWFVIKKSCYSSDRIDTFAVREIKSSEDQDVPMCHQGEYVKGSSLLIQDIVSTSGSLNPDEQQKRFFLQVDILIRNPDHDLPTLYTAGTPVVIDGLFQTEDLNTLADEEKAEFYYDNSLEEKDLEDYSNTEVKVSKINIENDYRQGSVNQYADSRMTVGQEQVLKDFNTDTSVLTKTGNNHFAIDNNFQTFNNIHKEIQQNNIGQIPRELDFPAMPVEQEFKPQNNLQQNHNQLPSPGVQNTNNQGRLGLQFQSQQNQIHHNFGTINQRSSEFKQLGQDNQRIRRENLNIIDEQREQPQENTIPYGLDPRFDNRFGDDTNFNSMNSANDNSPGEMNGVVGMNQEHDVVSNIDADGFQERLLRFKTEYYGRPVDNLSDQTATNYAMNNPSICESLDKIDVLFLISTIPQSDEQRQRIRSTFVKASLFQPFTIAHVFLVGLTSSPNFQGNLDKDQEKFGDIVQGEFSDKPEARTQKGLMGFRWVTTFCPKARFVFKLDEDVFVDTDKLLQGLIPAISSVIGEKAMLCFLVQNAPIPRSGPNAFDESIFPKSSRTRPYCKGFAMLTTVSTISSLVKASEHVPIFQFDDLYLYGILPFVAGEIELYDLGNKRAFHDFGMAVVNCYKDLQDKCPYVATKAFSSRFTSLWEFVTARKTPESQRFQGDPSLWNLKEYYSSFYD